MSSVAFHLLVILAAFVTTQALPYLNGEQLRRRRDAERTKRNLATSSHPNSSSSNPRNRTRRSFYDVADEDLGINVRDTGQPAYSRASNSRLGGSLSHQMYFMVSLEMKDDQGQWIHFCGASVLTPTTLLTAANCFPGRINNKIFRAVFGTKTINYGQAEGFDIHFNYMDVHKDNLVETEGQMYRVNDDAIIKIPGTIPFGVTIGPVCLANEDILAKVFTFGWGLFNCLDQSKIMRVARGWIDKKDICERKWSDGGRPLTVHEGQMCARFYSLEHQYVSIDLGDYGGPLVVPIYGAPGELKKVIQLGIASFVRRQPGWTPLCPDVFVPQVFTKVSKHMKFIKQWSPDAEWCADETDDDDDDD